MSEFSNQLPEIEFWFDPASTYSYIAASDVAHIEAEGRGRFSYHPFLLGPIFARQGWRDSPFNLYHAKGEYMWLDMARLCAERGLPLQRPGVFPRNSVLPASVALVGLDEGWGKRFVAALFTANFGHDIDTASAQGLTAVLADLGLEPARILALAEDSAIRARLRSSTTIAGDRGLFGAPTFIVGTELFWGSDRLQQALAHAEKLSKAADRNFANPSLPGTSAGTGT